MRTRQFRLEAIDVVAQRDPEDEVWQVYVDGEKIGEVWSFTRALERGAVAESVDGERCWCTSFSAAVEAVFEMRSGYGLAA